MNGNLISEAWRSLVARILQENYFLQARVFAITNFLTLIKAQKTRGRDETLVARMHLHRIF